MGRSFRYISPAQQPTLESGMSRMDDHGGAGMGDTSNKTASSAGLKPEQAALLWPATRRLLGELAGGDSAAILGAVVESLATLLAADACRVYLAAQKSGRLLPKAVHPPTWETNVPDFPIESLGELRPSLDASCAFFCFTATDRALAQWRQARVIAETTRAVLVVALVEAGGKTSALIVAERKSSEAGFTEADEALARAWGDMARAALGVLKHQTDAAAQQAGLKERLAQISAAFGLANAELARAARLSDQFLANMSHELRTPLNTILGMSQALQEGVMGPVTDDQMSYLQMVEKAGRNLLTMITDILTLSKAGAGRLDLHPDLLSVQAACQECLQFVIQPARQKHLKIEIKCDPRVTMLEADENILKQILVNLLTNAVKFTGERGAVTLEVTGDLDRQTVVFEVRDTGIGIAPENFAQLFHPFVQLDDGLARTYPGTGLGLSLIFRLSELHGGSVAVDSQLGQGSRFTVRLPWTPIPKETAPVPAISTNAKAHILLVDDNERTIKQMQDALTSAGHRVTITRQGAEALERAAEDRPTLMLVDLQLAGMNGWALLKHVRSSPRLAGVGIVALTAMEIPGDHERCLEAGADDYLVKPVARPVLLEAVERCLKTRADSTSTAH